VVFVEGAVLDGDYGYGGVVSLPLGVSQGVGKAWLGACQGSPEHAA
jgi:hypothetical protein